MIDTSLSTSEVGSLDRLNIGMEDVVIQVEGLCKIYGKFVAVKGIDLTVNGDEIFGLIGTDGTGKTRLFTF